jgi:transposase
MRMEDVLDLYATELPEDETLVCMDESNKQHIEETKDPIPTKAGEPMKYDYEYKRNGVSALFMFFAPNESWRHVIVDDYKRSQEWVEHMRTLSDDHFPHMNKIHIVLDNFKTHNPKMFYQYFTPEVARRLTEKFVFHYTPKHASWLNMAEIEFSALFGQALNKRIPDQEALKREITAWENNRNANTKTIDWKFTTKDARIKLKKLYPTIVDIG